MTSIKPPTGPITTLPHTSTGLDSAPASGIESAESLQPTAESSRTGDLRSVSESHVGSTGSVEQVGTARGVGEVQQVNLVDLAKAVEAGELTMGQAVERLVEGTVGSLARQLTDLEQGELSELLRQAVATDPALGAMSDEPV